MQAVRNSGRVCAGVRNQITLVFYRHAVLWSRRNLPGPEHQYRQKKTENSELPGLGTYRFTQWRPFAHRVRLSCFPPMR